jgi:hypothetical protein
MIAVYIKKTQAIIYVYVLVNTKKLTWKDTQQT